MIVGAVAALRRYPVKSMQGEHLERIALETTGMAGDREWAVFDPAESRVLSAKRVGQLLEGAAVSTPTGPRITLPGDVVLEPGAPDTDERLSAWLGRTVELRGVESAGAPFRMSLNIDDEEADLFDMPTPPTRFLDLSPIHVLTNASLAAASELRPESDWNVDRFRPGIFVETDRSGFPEEEWVGSTLRIGDAELAPILTTPRCVMTTRAQPTHGIDRDRDVLQTLARENSQNLGVYAEVPTPGTIQVGDSVELLAR